MKHRTEVLTWSSDQGDDYFVAQNVCLMANDGTDVAEVLAAIRAGDMSLFSRKGMLAKFLPNAIEIPDMEHLMFLGSGSGIQKGHETSLKYV